MKLRLNEDFVKKRNYQQDLLCAILGCNTYELDILQYCQYDYSKVVGICGNDLSLNGLIDSIFELGIAEIQQQLNNRISEIEFSDDDNDQVEYDLLVNLNPYEDIKKEMNSIASDIYFVDNQDIYREYLLDVIETVESKMGFEFIDFWI